jgi:hypothetical protein
MDVPTNKTNISNILIHYICQSVCDRGFGGWGRERSVKQRVIGVSLWQGWTTTVFVYKPSPQNIAAVRRVGMTVGSHPFPTAPKADIKTFPSPPPLPPYYRKNRRLYRGACFQKFPKLSGTKVQNVKTGVLGFLMSGKGVNTRTDNLSWFWYPHNIGWDHCAFGVARVA